MMDGSYPPGVYGWMLDDFFDRDEPPETCETCMFYEERTCGYICSIAEAEFTGEELGAMTDNDYMQKFGRSPDDHCYDYERWED